LRIANDLGQDKIRALIDETKNPKYITEGVNEEESETKIMLQWL